MGWLWKSSDKDREHILSVLPSLGPTTVAGLAAALSWSERRTEREVERLGADPRIDLEYDPNRRTVRLRPAPLPVARPAGASEPASVPALPGRSAPSAEGSHLRAPPPAALPRAWRTDVKCGTCHVPLEATGTPSLAYCPNCGRLMKAPSAAAPVERPTEPPSPTGLVAPAVARTAPTPSLEDRRSQELFAQYVTSQRIPCPKCKTPLRHHGVGVYRCPACANEVAFQSLVPGKGGTPTNPPMPAQ